MGFSRGAAFDYLERLFGGPLRAVEETATVNMAGQLAVGMDGESIAVVFVNLGASTLYIAPSNAVAATRGIRLGPTGGLAAFAVSEDGLLPTLEWWVISDALAGTLYTLRVRREAATKNGEGAL